MCSAQPEIQSQHGFCSQRASADPTRSFVLLGNSLSAASMVLVAAAAATKASAYERWSCSLAGCTPFPGKRPDDFDAELAILKSHLNKKPGNIVNVGRFMRASKVGVATTFAELGQYPSLPVLAFVGRKDPDYADVNAEVKWLAESVPHIQVFEDDER